MNGIALRFLQDLQEIARQFDEFYDTDVRESIFVAILNGFLRRRKDYSLPQSFAMLSEAGDSRVRTALERFLQAANGQAERLGCLDPVDRLILLRDVDIPPPEEANYYDNFFKYLEPTML